jgi:hypothetical protein
LSAGTYILTASTNDTHVLAASSSSTSLKILPATIQVQTVPAISGVTFQMDGQQFISGEDGFANIKVNKPGEYRLEILADQYQNPSQRIEFARWLEEIYQPYRDIRVPYDGIIQVGLNVYHQVGQSFMDLDGFPVDSQRISEFSIRSAQGDVFVFHDGQPRWIPASRVAHYVNGLEEAKLLYSVTSVTVDGSNVVNQSQQRFYTEPNQTLPISLLLYSLHISAQDALFASPSGKSVNVEFPDGRIENYPLDKAGIVDIHSLARGNYYIQLVGTKGLNNRLPVALSRNQVVNTKVITYLDLAVVGAIGILIALGLLVYGRPWLLLIFRKKNQQSVMREDWAPAYETFSSGPARLYTPPLPLPIKYETIEMLKDEDFTRSTGINLEMFEKMLAYLNKNLHSKGRPTKLNIANQLLVTLIYLQQRHTLHDIGQAYSVSEETVRRAIKKVENVFIKSDEFHLPEKNTVQPGGTTIIEAVQVNTIAQQVELSENSDVSVTSI